MKLMRQPTILVLLALLLVPSLLFSQEAARTARTAIAWERRVWSPACLGRCVWAPGSSV